MPTEPVNNGHNDGRADETPFVGAPWIVPLAHVGDQLTRQIVASDDVCRWVEQELEVPTCTSLICDMDLRPGRRGSVVGTLRLRVTMVQVCVVTLEAFDVHVDDLVDAEFWPPAQIEAWDRERGQEAEIEEDSPDPEPILDGRLPVGALVHQALVMAIDAHPRKPGVEFGIISTESEADLAAEKPFAALAKLRGDPQNS